MVSAFIGPEGFRRSWKNDNDMGTGQVFSAVSFCAGVGGGGGARGFSYVLMESVVSSVGSGIKGKYAFV